MIVHTLGGDKVFEYSINIPKDALISYADRLKEENVGQYTGENKRSNSKGFQSFEYFFGLYKYHQIEELEAIFKNIKNLIIDNFDSRFHYSLNNYWVNINIPGSYNKLHNHVRPYTDSQGVSGTFYIEVPENSGNIIFKNNDESLEIKSANNKLLLFPSYLDHEVSKNLSLLNRYSIAFNYDMIKKNFKRSSI